MNAGNTDVDLLLAIQLQEQFEEELKQQRIPYTEESVTNFLSSPTHHAKGRHNTQHDTSTEPLSVSLIDPVWELIDPVPEVHSLFCTYNDQFFWGKLHAVAVSWSPRMTVCAGVCSYERRGGLCSIRLSVPLLKLRPRSDLVETLLHEMIHAYLFVTANNRDRDGHGPEFHKHMHRINQRARTKISVYHSFHSEVAVYKQHVWQCSGPCRRQGPYYGLVKRSMNRAPGPNDRWWAQHQATCGGSYTKIREPEGYGVKGAKAKALPGSSGVTSKGKNTNDNTRSVTDIRNFFTGSGISLGKKSTNQSSGAGPSSVNPSIKKPIIGAQRGITEGISSAGAGKSWKASGISAVKDCDSGSNIRGFGSISNASVTSVGVPNAPRSNIVGFNKGLNKTSITKNSNSSSTTNAKGKYSKSGSWGGGATGPDRGGSNKGGSYGTSGSKSTESGMRGVGLAGFGGSGTVLVKPRPAKTKQETKTKDVGIESSSTVNDGADLDEASSARPTSSLGSGFVLGATTATSTSVLTNRTPDSQSLNGRSLLGGSIGSSRHPDPPGRPVSRLLVEYEAAAAAAKLRTKATTDKISSTTAKNNQNASNNAASGTVWPSEQDDGGASRRKLLELDSEEGDGSDSSDDDVPLNSTYRPFKYTSTSKNKSSTQNNNSKTYFNKNDGIYKMNGNCNTSPEKSDGLGSTELTSTDRTVIIDSDSENEGNDDTHRECPLCCHPVLKSDFCVHIAECVGDWDLLAFDDIEDLNNDNSMNKGRVTDKSDRSKRRNDDGLCSDSEDDDTSLSDTKSLKKGLNASQSKRRKKDDVARKDGDYSSDVVKDKKLNSDVINVKFRETGHNYGDCSVDFFDDLGEDVLKSLEERAQSTSQRSSYKLDDNRYNNSLPKAVDSLRGKPPSLTVAASKLKKNEVATSQSTSSSTGLSRADATKNRRNRVPPNEDRYIYVSDTDDEFDERYWHMPVSSIVQTSLGDNSGVYDISHGPTRTTEAKSVGSTSSVKQTSTSGVATAVVRQLQATPCVVQAKDPPKYPCPVCQELFTEEYITTTHLNTHFS